MAAISTTHLTSGSTTNATSATSASISPVSNNLILLGVLNVVGSGTANIPSISGNGLTWNQIATLLVTGSTVVRVSLFAAISASPSSGSPLISFSGQTQNSIAWLIDEMSGVDYLGESTSNIIVQNATNSTASTGTGIAVTLSSFKSSSNATYGVIGRNGNIGLSAGSNFTELVNQSSNVIIESEWASSPQTSVNWTWGSTNQPTAAIAVEVKALVQGGSFLFNFL